MPIRVPKYRKHATGQAFVRIRGKNVYLGVHGSERSLAEYERIIGEIRASGDQEPVVTKPADAKTATLNEVMLLYVDFASGYYVKGGKPTGQVQRIKSALRPVRELFGHLSIDQFGPLCLKRVREEMIKLDWCRNYINSCVGCIVRMFKWAASEQKVPASVWESLRTVEGLRRGRTAARETEAVQPVPEAFIKAVKPYVSRQIAAMIDLQRFTGARSTEVCLMRTVDLNMSGTVWEYTPQSHKCQHHGHEKTLYLGPKAQAIVREWLRTDVTSYLFQPCEAEAERKAELRRNRKTKVQPSQQNRAKAKPKRKPKDHYNRVSYAQAITRACRKAGVPEWSPHQLKHNAGTAVRREFGVEVARAVLGHRNVSTTELYAQADAEKAREPHPRVGVAGQSGLANGA